MGKAAKIVFVAGTIVVIVVLVIVFLVVSNLDKIVKKVIETEGSAALGTELAVGKVEIDLTEAEGSLAGLTVRNPPGFESDHAFEMDRISLTLDPTSIGSDEIVLKEIAVDGAHLTYEDRGGANNLKTILNHLEQAPETEQPADEPLLVIERFKLHAAQVTVIHPELEEPLSLTLPDLVLQDIGRVGAGETATSAAKQIMRPILDATVDAAKQRAKDELEGRVKQQLDEEKGKALDSLKNKLLGGK